MDVRLHRQLWSAVEATPNHRLAHLDDSGVLQWLIDLLQADPTFDTRNVPIVSSYILTRMPLIRDIAQQA